MLSAGRGYVIFTENIRDPEGMAVYAAAMTPLLEKYGGNVLVADPDVHVLEGSWDYDQTVVIEFESVSAARRWYFSAEYQNGRAMREAVAEANVVLVAGLASSGIE